MDTSIVGRSPAAAGLRNHMADHDFNSAILDEVSHRPWPIVEPAVLLGLNDCQIAGRWHRIPKPQTG